MLEWLFSWEVTSVVTALFITIALAVLALSDYKPAKIFFVLAAFDAAGGMIMWGRHSDINATVRNLATFLAVGTIGVATMISLRYVDRKHNESKPTAPAHNLPRSDDPQAFARQVAAELAKDAGPHKKDAVSDDRYGIPERLKEIDEFICQKDENGLRDTFDFPDIIKYNVRFAKRNLNPASTSQVESKQIDEFFQNGRGVLDARYAKISSVNNRAEVVWIPGKIGVINTSSKFVKNKAKLTGLLSSSLLPSDVSKSLKAFDEAVDQNLTIMIESLNESLAADPRNILANENYGSHWYGSASGLYWAKFVALRPKADAVSAAVHNAMTTSHNQPKP